jgi:hypothetical protein
MNSHALAAKIATLIGQCIPPSHRAHAEVATLHSGCVCGCHSIQ